MGGKASPETQQTQAVPRGSTARQACQGMRAWQGHRQGTVRRHRPSVQRSELGGGMDPACMCCARAKKATTLSFLDPISNFLQTAPDSASKGAWAREYVCYWGLRYRVSSTSSSTLEGRLPTYEGPSLEPACHHLVVLVFMYSACRTACCHTQGCPLPHRRLCAPHGHMCTFHIGAHAFTQKGSHTIVQASACTFCLPCMYILLLPCRQGVHVHVCGLVWEACCCRRLHCPH